MPNNDLISRAAAIAEIEEYIDEYSELDLITGYHNLKWCAMEEAKDVLLTLPAVDTVPVVRCETCKHWSACESEENDCDIYGVCNQIGRFTIFDWFCADGEAKTNEAD